MWQKDKILCCLYQASIIRENWLDTKTNQATTVGIYVLASIHLFNPKVWNCTTTLKMESLSTIKVGWLSGLRRYPDLQADAGSNPGWVYSFFLQFLQFPQTLRACHAHIGNFRKTGPFPLKSRVSGVSLHTVKSHAVSRHLCVSLVWKLTIFRSKIAQFLPFS